MLPASGTAPLPGLFESAIRCNLSSDRAGRGGNMLELNESKQSAGGREQIAGSPEGRA